MDNLSTKELEMFRVLYFVNFSLLLVDPSAGIMFAVFVFPMPFFASWYNEYKKWK